MILSLGFRREFKLRDSPTGSVGTPISPSPNALPGSLGAGSTSALLGGGVWGGGAGETVHLPQRYSGDSAIPSALNSEFHERCL